MTAHQERSAAAGHTIPLVWIIGLFLGGVMAAKSLSAYDSEDTINCNGAERGGIGGPLQIEGIAAQGRAGSSYRRDQGPDE